MKLKTLAVVATLFALSPLANAGYLCSYDAQITSSNKSNTSGANLAKSKNRASAAAILQQERADHYTYGNDNDDDCYFSSKSNRMKIASMLNRGHISQATINSIVSGEPSVHVDVYSNFISVSVE